MAMQPFLNRRSVLKAGLATAGFGLTSVAGLQQSWGLTADNPYLATLGLQLWTVRNQMAEDDAGTIKAIAEAGYYQVELGDVMAADRLVKLANDNGMKVTSSFIDWTVLGDMKVDPSGKVEAMIEKASEHGLKHLVFGYVGKGHRESVDQIKRIAERSNEAGEKCLNAGIQLCYHHHSFEFQPLENGVTAMDVMKKEFDPKFMPFEIDVFWAAIGGVEPIGLLKELKGRVSQVHLKDLKANTAIEYDEGAVPHDAFLECGEGTIDMSEVMKVSEEIGVVQCHVEQDQSPNPLASVRLSLNNLRGT